MFSCVDPDSGSILRKYCTLYTVLCFCSILSWEIISDLQFSLILRIRIQNYILKTADIVRIVRYRTGFSSPILVLWFPFRYQELFFCSRNRQLCSCRTVQYSLSTYINKPVHTFPRFLNFIEVLIRQTSLVFCFISNIKRLNYTSSLLLVFHIFVLRI